MKCVFKNNSGKQLGPQPDSVSFLINGTKYSVAANDTSVGPESRLVDFIRDQAKLKGTKWTCREGGCGACVVTVRTKDPQNGQEVIRAVNSCLAPIYACDGWDISTVEDLGNKRDGYHPIQKRLAQFGGTQCGFCSSGMVMNMYSLASAKKEGLTSQDVEDNFDGNICRCTGYRPILDAMKSFTVDAAPELKKKCQDIEDFCKSCPAANVTNGGGAGPSGGGCCGGGCAGRAADFSLASAKLDLFLPTGEKWVKATDLKFVFETVKNFAKNNLKYRIVAGNTGSGVFKNDGPYDAYIEVNSVPELTVTSVNKTEAVFGGGNTLTRTIDFLKNLSSKPGFEYAGLMSKHIKRVANNPVRNFGTVAGNLMMKHAHNDFPSDIFLLLETAGAKINIASTPTDIQAYSPVDFLKVDMKGRVIVYITLPIRDANHVFRSFKITKRYQNAHAYVNAGFLFPKVDSTKNFRVVEKPTICFGGISKTFVRASKTETALTGVELGDVKSLQKALHVLEGEIEPDHHLPDATPQYRKSLALNLLYKAILGIVNKGVQGKLQSGGEDLPRKQNSAKQEYDADVEFKDSPLYKPVPKLEAAYQCAGEAEYVNDIPHQSGELYGAFVRVTVANCTLKNVDASEALKIPGVVTFLTAKDIPGKNAFYNGFAIPVVEELFVESKIKASGQSVGLIVAETQEIANAAVKLVKVEYKDFEKPLLTIKDGVEKARKEGTFDQLLYPMIIKTADEPSKTSKNTIKGQFQIGGQAHFQMETHVTLCIPKEDGLKVYSATQWTDLTQGMIASLLNIPNNSIDLEVKRLGGAYGSKISRSMQIALAAALATHHTRRPVRVVIDLEANLEMMGKRLPYYVEYEAGFDDNGKIDGLQAKIICDPGMIDADGTSIFAAMFMQSCYATSGWLLNPGRVLTNTHTNTFCRAPGTTQGIAIIENIIEHIADKLGKDPLAVRDANYLKAGDALLPAPGAKFEGVNLAPALVEEMKKIADYDERKRLVEDFNKNNRWRKRGLAMVPMRYLQGYHGMKYTSYVAVHNQDGTVSVSHGGIECGQGINTKVAQVVAHLFGIPLSMIAIKSSNNLLGMNSDPTGGAITSELVCYATMQACQTILGRMEPIKKGAEGELKWEELVKKCNAAGVDLRATHFYTANDPVKPYDIYGCNLIEAEIDVLTGEYKIVRLDLIEDAGKSLSPEVDMGQIEGSLIMGLGLWTEEKLYFDPDTGRLLTRNTWEYKVPFPKSIPEDMRITIMRNAPNPMGVLRSKATGEPPVCLGVTVLFAIKNAIKAARKDAGNTEWFQLDGPVTPEDVARLSLTNPQSQFVY